MPHTPTAKKRLRQNVKRRARNRTTIKDVKSQVKNVAEVAAAGTPEQLQAAYRLAAKKLDKAASQRVIHPNLAARKKSQLARLLNAKAQGGATAPAAK